MEENLEQSRRLLAEMDALLVRVRALIWRRPTLVRSAPPVPAGEHSAMCGSEQKRQPIGLMLLTHPMADDTVYTRTMRRAIETLGGPAQLSTALGASVLEIEAWAAGFTIPPPGVFLKAIDLLSQYGWNPGRPAAP